MTRTQAETATLLYEKFDASSRYWLHDRQEQDFARGPQPSVEQAISMMAAAIGGQANIEHALAGVKLDTDGRGSEFQFVALTAELLIDTVFALRNTDVRVTVTPRAALRNLTVTGAGSMNSRPNPGRLAFTAEYDDGMAISYPLRGDASNAIEWIETLFASLQADLVRRYR